MRSENVVRNWAISEECGEYDGHHPLTKPFSVTSVIQVLNGPKFRQKPHQPVKLEYLP